MKNHAFTRFLLVSVILLPLKVIGHEGVGRERILMDAEWRFRLGTISGSEINNGIVITNWRYQGPWKTKPADIEKSLGATGVKTSGSDWKDAVNGKDLFDNKPGFALCRAVMPDFPGPHRVLHFAGVDDNCTVYVNGKKMIYHEGWNDSFDIDLDPVWKEGGSNEAAVLVENIWGGGNIKEADLLSPDRVEKIPDAAMPGYYTKGWKKIHIPHDFVVEGTFDFNADGSHGFLPKNAAWYQKTFDLPISDKGKALWIDFDGIYRDSRVWLNGKLLGRHLSGYTGFRYDITQAANYGGKNVLTVYVDARDSEGWWYEGGGIYRHVWINKAYPLHVEPWGVCVVSATNRESNPTQAAVRIETSMINAAGVKKAFRLVSQVKDAHGKIVGKLSGTKILGAGSKTVLSQKISLARPHLWSLEDPYLYTLETNVMVGSNVVDSVTTPFGIRTIRFDIGRGFFLNGRPVKIKGTCNHQDFAGIGIAISDRIFAYRLDRLKDMGSNAYRCSHNPPAAELLDECDRKGVLVMDENRKLGDTPEILDQVRSMVLRDRNHPSVILWSLCNEEALQGSPTGQARGEAMKKMILGLDKTRLITCAMNGGFGSGLSNVVDLQGFNYHPKEYEPYHQNHPKIPIFGSETGSTVSTRGIYADAKDKGYVSAYDVNPPGWANTAEETWQAIDRPYMAGCFVWTGFDYRGEPTPYWWPCINSHFGLMDICGFPKDNFYYYQSVWTGKPMVHLLPHWTWKGKEGREIAVWAYSNCDQVELFLNGKSLGVKDNPKDGHMEWKVKYEPGTLSAKGSKDGMVAAEDKVETAGAPAKIRLTPYQTGLLADGEDEMPVKVEILDSENRIVPTAGNEVTFRVTGPGLVAGVANGDPSSHERDKVGEGPAHRKAFNGLCMAVVGSTNEAGPVTLTATSAGLEPATVVLISTVP